MRVLLWHGWLLEGSGSNVYTAKTAEALRHAGHQVLLLCQEPHPERFAFADAWGTVDGSGVTLTAERTTAAGRRAESSGRAGRVFIVRPLIGSPLPVFVIDEYEGFDRVVQFVDLTAGELDAYLGLNVTALAAAARWFEPQASIVGHAVPGAVVAARALGPGAYIAKIHGSDLEYAIKPQRIFRELAREGLTQALAVVGATRDVLSRATGLVPGIEDRVLVIPPGVEVDRFHPRFRAPALLDTARLLDGEPPTAEGRPEAVDAKVEAAVAGHDGSALEAIALTYDQSAPDPGAAHRLRQLSNDEGPIVGYLGKFIPQKGPHLLLQALALVGPDIRSLIIGFGQFREWLTALVRTLDGSPRDLDWLREAFPVELEISAEHAKRARGLTGRVTFTGRLDHRFAPGAVAAMDVLVVPSILDEAFGMVAAEGAAAGALPLVARHSGLAEVAAALETAADRPGLFSYEPGPAAHLRIAEGLRQLLSIPPQVRAELSSALSRFVAREWTWDRTARRLLQAASAGRSDRAV